MQLFSRCCSHMCHMLITCSMTRLSAVQLQILGTSGITMPILKLQRVRFSTEADNRLKMLKARTGLTPNIICRLGLCLSLDEPGQPRSDSSEPSQREIT